MSSTLKWRPAVPTEGYSLPSELKRAISRKLWDTDGSTGGPDATMTDADIPYLEGLRDAGIKGAEELIEIISKHGVVILWHEH